MKYILYSAIVAVSMFTVGCKTTYQKPKQTACCAPQEGVESAKMDSLTKFQQVTYALGHTVASDMNKNGIDSLDLDLLKLAFNDVLNGDTNRVGADKTQELLRFLTDSMRAVQQAEQLKQYLPNKKAGEDYLNGLKANDSVKFTPSGLAYKITRKGNGVKPGPEDKVTAHYEGSLIDGSIFDSSYPRGNPSQFPLNRVIPGWTEGLQLISEGAEIYLYIPYDLGYGENGSGERIPPYSTLIFKVELITVENAHKGHNHAPGEHK